ncbi:MAG: hypothetical protein RL616_673 [Verrucomicrobiota bacterium]
MIYPIKTSSTLAILLATLGLLAPVRTALAGDGWAAAGFLFDSFDLVLEPGHRTEAAGPFYYSETRADDATLALPPLISFYENKTVQHGEINLLYPLLTYENYGSEWRWQFFELLSFAGGQEQNDLQTHRFTIFPVYFQQRSLDTNLNYTCVMPIYGHLQRRLFRDEMFVVLFPLFSETRKKDVVTDNYLWPVGHVRHGNHLDGWQVWPIAGSEHKDLTTLTNGFGDVTTIGGHDRSFVLWPFWLSQDNNLGTENPEKFRASVPLFATTRSPNRDVTSVLWPLFTWIDEREKKYHEWEGPWPFVIFTRGEGKTTDRVWPLFSQSHNATQSSDAYLWPIYTRKQIHDETLERSATRVLFYLYVGVSEKNKETGAEKLRRDSWPLFTWRKDFNGNTRLQFFAPFESILSSSRGIERNWSPLWTVWHSEKNPRAGGASQSLLWNLYRHEVSPGHQKTSLLFGLFQRQTDGEKTSTKLFYLPVSR